MKEILYFTAQMFIILVLTALLVYILGKLEIWKIRKRTKALEALNREEGKRLQLLRQKWNIEDQIFDKKQEAKEGKTTMT